MPKQPDFPCFWGGQMVLINLFASPSHSDGSGGRNLNIFIIACNESSTHLQYFTVEMIMASQLRSQLKARYRSTLKLIHFEILF